MENNDDQSKKIQELLSLDRKRKTLYDKIFERINSITFDPDKKKKFTSFLENTNKIIVEFMSPLFEIDIDEDDFNDIYNNAKTGINKTIDELKRAYNEIFASNESLKLIPLLKQILKKHKI